MNHPCLGVHCGDAGTTTTTMGNAPTRPTPAQASAMHSNLDDACTRAARAMAESDVLILCLGDRLQEASTTAAAAEAAGTCDSSTAHATSSLLESDPSLFYGTWGHQFNVSRTSGPHPAFEILSRWCKKFAASPAAAKLRERQAQKNVDEQLPDPARVTPAWKQMASRAGSSRSDHAQEEEDEVELMYGSSDEENEAEKELTFDLRDPGAFHIFTSNTNGMLLVHYTPWLKIHGLRLFQIKITSPTSPLHVHPRPCRPCVRAQCGPGVPRLS